MKALQLTFRGVGGIALALVLAITLLLGRTVWSLSDQNRRRDAAALATAATEQLRTGTFLQARDSVRALAVHPAVGARLAASSVSGSPDASLLSALMQARLTTGATVVYLMNAQGIVLDSSTEESTLDGHNYSFRPYFREAMAGREALYAARGVTTARRGFYFSAPVRSTPASMPIGVVVVKLGLAPLDAQLKELDVPAALLSPEGIVFASNRPEWLLRAAFPLDSATRSELARTRQFGDDAIVALDFDLRQASVAIEGKQYGVERRPLPALGGWQLVVADPERWVPLDRSQLELFLAATLGLVCLAGLIVALLITRTRRARTEAALARNRENLDLIFDSLGDAVVVTDRAGCISRLNPVAVRLTGWTAEEAMGQPLERVVRTHLAPSPTSPHNPRPVIGDSRQAVLVSRGGDELSIASCASPLRGDNGDPMGVVLVFRDTTEEQRLQEQLRHAHKMEAIGQLAGGVAHDFNNLLAGMMGNAELLLLRLKDDGVRGNAQEILRAIQRAADLTRQLLAFSRKGKVQSRDVDLHELVREVLQLLRRSVDPRVELKQQLDAYASTVRGDPSQLQSALLNLALNARDAMPTGGTLTIRTRNSIGPGGSQRVELSVTDTGVGMTPDVREHIFEPFFTTKATGAGTGLGLAAVYGCVRSHGGEILVESAPGAGSTFQIVLPAVLESDEAPPSSQEAPSLKGEGLVLVIDDDDTVRSLLSAGLREWGYDVLEAADGVEGLQSFREHHREVAVILLDLSMPRMSGEETLRELRELDLQVPVVLMSGFTSSRVQSLLSDGGADDFLAKPFPLDDLGRAIARQIRHNRRRRPRPENGNP